ncbi:MAG TPA: FHA domain-containing protein [Pirellulaceae bacterium]|nr:FHA domain-containing protein [Pirellulaceae bacterium]
MSQIPEFWCSRRLLVTVDGPQGQSVIPLDRPVARIGREPGSDIVLNSPWVARRSLYLHATDEGVFCFFFEPEEKVSQRLGIWLAPGEPVLLGPYRISVCLEGDEPGPAPALTPMDERGSVLPPLPMLHIYAGDQLRAKRRLHARLNLVGRRHQCALQLNAQQVSAFHGCFYWQYPRLWYVDLVSSNGTSRGGQKIDCCEVHIGDRLEIGEFTLVFQRLSRGGAAARQSRVSATARHAADEMPPAALDDQLPLNVEEQPLSVEPAHAQTGDTEMPVAKAATTTAAAPVDEATLAAVAQTRQELSLLQQRVEELSQFTLAASTSAAQELAVQSREAFQRERERIAQELEHRAGELAQTKLALEERWLTTSRELATQVSQLRDEATLLARQRQAMEKSRLSWDAQRSQVDRQLRTYAQQLARLQQSAPLAIASAAENEAATALVLAAAGDGGALTARSHVVDTHVADQQPKFFTNETDLPGIGFSADAVGGAPPDASSPAANVLDGTLAAEAPAAQAADPAAPLVDAAPRPVIRRRKTSKGKEVFGIVTDRLVELDRGRRRTMVLVGIAGGLAAVALATLMIVAAVLLR